MNFLTLRIVLQRVIRAGVRTRDGAFKMTVRRLHGCNLPTVRLINAPIIEVHPSCVRTVCGRFLAETPLCSGNATKNG
jgi:hypothetical protein